jgi:hypothetical protein
MAILIVPIEVPCKRLVQLDTLIEQIEFSLQRGTSAAVATAPLRGSAFVSRIQ